MLKRIWNDPVWSNVVAGLILGAGAGTATYLLDWWPWIRQTLGIVADFVLFDVAIPIWLLVPLMFVIPTALAAVRRFTSFRKERFRNRFRREYRTDIFGNVRFRWDYNRDRVS